MAIVWIDLGGGTQSLSSNTENRIINSGYVYDAAGNLTNDSVQSFAFDAENKIKTVNGENDVYRYDANGNRVRKNFTYGEKVRMVYSGGQLIAEYDLSNGSLKKEYVYGAKGLIATIEPSAGTKYTTTDSLGTPRVITGSTGSVVSRHDYKPFGEEVGSGIGGRTTGMGYDAADGMRQKFTQKERDNESGLDYARARYYSSGQGRFTSTDPFMFSAGTSNPQTWNSYSYVLNKPTNLIDPSGLAAQSLSGGCSAEFSRCDGQEGGSQEERAYEHRVQTSADGRLAQHYINNGNFSAAQGIFETIRMWDFTKME